MKTLAESHNFSDRKKTIARHFATANDYEQHANIQLQVCHYLLASIANTKQDSVLEIGAGTGQMTRLLAAHIQSEHWLINELCSEQAALLQSILPSADIVIGDAEFIDLQQRHSLIISANAVQWFDDPLNFVAQSVRRLQAQGQLVFNTFTPNNFLQIKHLTGQGLNYPDIDEWREVLTTAGFEDIQLSVQRFNLPFATPYAVLKHMQLTGVSTNRTQLHLDSGHSFSWTKSRLKKFELEYWQHYSHKDQDMLGVYLTYEVLKVSAIKP